MRRTPALLLALSLLGCETTKAPPADSVPAASEKPRVPSVSQADQRKLKRDKSEQVLPNVGSPTDGRETEAGLGFRAEAAKGCSDRKCVGDNCSKLCAKWMKDGAPPSTAADMLNKLYLSCLGSCLREDDE